MTNNNGHNTHYFVIDEHHIDDEDEAASYINLYVQNSTAFVMDMPPGEKEQDTTPVKGSNSMHEFRYVFHLLHSQQLIIGLLEKREKCKFVSTSAFVKHVNLKILIVAKNPIMLVNFRIGT